MGGIRNLKKRAPMLGGNFCAWMGLFGSFQCVMLYLTKRDTHINQVVAGGLTGATINIRGGYKYALRGGMQGAVFIGVFNIMEIFMNKSREKSRIEQKKMKADFELLNQLTYISQQRPELLTMTEEQISYEKEMLIQKIRDIHGIDMDAMK